MFDSRNDSSIQAAAAAEGEQVEMHKYLLALDMCCSALSIMHSSVDGSNARMCLMKSNGVGDEMRHSRLNRISCSIEIISDFS